MTFELLQTHYVRRWSHLLLSKSSILYRSTKVEWLCAARESLGAGFVRRSPGALDRNPVGGIELDTALKASVIAQKRPHAPRSFALVGKVKLA